MDIESGTYTGGVTFNVGQGAVVDLTGGDTVTYGGTLTGSGSGTVQFSGGIDPAAGSGDGPANAGLTLNFPGSMFQWTGGGIFASLGDVTNLGTINLAGSERQGVLRGRHPRQLRHHHPDRHRQPRPAQRQRVAHHADE